MEVPHDIIFRGAVFADSAMFDRCTDLWLRALELRHRNHRSIAKDLLRFAQVNHEDQTCLCVASLTHRSYKVSQSVSQ